MKTVMIGKVEVGTGMPKVIVPIVEKTKEEIAAKGKLLRSYSMDVVEWRVDFFEGVNDIAKVLDCAEELKKALGDIPILFTFRTAKEGGEKAIETDAYVKLNCALIQSGFVDACDVEVFTGDEAVRTIIAAAHEAGKAVVASNHDFHKTPAKDDLLYRLRKMKDLGADIPKIAVMPTCPADVLTLLEATEKMKREYADGPIITMSMGPMGVISRIAGEAFGSAMTFGAVGKVSAPGQIPVEKLQEAMQILHEGM